MNNITKILGIVALTGGLASCSSDYLDLEPLGQIYTEDVMNSESSITLATNALSQSMYRQYADYYDYGWFDGEPWIAMVYGEVVGQDYSSTFWQYYHRQVPNWIFMSDNTRQVDNIAWMYCYGLINQANAIINGVPEDLIYQEDANYSEPAFRVAQALTMRAHSYTRLLQIYGPRWADSSNGQALAVPLRTVNPSPEDIAEDLYSAPLASMNAVLDQIYEDLDKAIELFDYSGWGRDYLWETDIDVAMGVYARAALLKDDWQTAFNMASEVASYYPIMSAEEFVYDGFAVENSEWIWSSGGASAGIYYASFGSNYACNGPYGSLWGDIGAGAVNYDLYRQMYDENDIRCSLFFTPDKVDSDDQYLFWSTTDVDRDNMNTNTGGYLTDYVYDFILEKWNNVNTAWPIPFNSYYYYWQYGYFDIYDSSYGMYIDVPFGQQFKFWGTDPYGTSCFPFMRASEMYLTAAEAACHIPGYEMYAQQFVDMVQENRIEGYSGTTLSGQALLDYVKLVRRWELWGEGFNWFDYKRWNEPIVRPAWGEDDPNSGNFPAQFAGTWNVTDYNNWRWVIPRSETQYNEDIQAGGQVLQ